MKTGLSLTLIKKKNLKIKIPFVLFVLLFLFFIFLSACLLVLEDFFWFTTLNQSLSITPS